MKGRLTFFAIGGSLLLGGAVVWLSVSHHPSESVNTEQGAKFGEAGGDSGKARVEVDQKPALRRLELAPGKKMTAAHFHSAERMRTVRDDLSAWCYPDLTATRDGAWLDLALHWDLSRTPPYLQQTSQLHAGDRGQVVGSGR